MKLLFLFALLVSTEIYAAAKYPESTVDMTLQRVSEHVHYVQGEAGIATDNQGFISNAAAVVTDEGLVIVDMHAAHERITYERLKTAMDGEGIRSQPLLVPVTIKVSAREADLAESSMHVFEELGFTLDRMGPETLVLRQVPGLLRNADGVSLIRDVLSDLAAFGDSQRLREEMNAIGGQEMTMPVIHPADIWQETGRWYQIGSEMGRFQDKNARDMVLAMTHEEVVADLVRCDIERLCGVWAGMPVQE